MAHLTRKEVEERIIERIGIKVDTMQSQVNRAVRTTIDRNLIMDFYRTTIIPLTKQGEIAYLLNRTSA